MHGLSKTDYCKENLPAVLIYALKRYLNVIFANVKTILLVQKRCNNALNQTCSKESKAGEKLE